MWDSAHLVGRAEAAHKEAGGDSKTIEEIRLLWGIHAHAVGGYLAVLCGCQASCHLYAIQPKDIILPTVEHALGHQVSMEP